MKKIKLLFYFLGIILVVLSCKKENVQEPEYIYSFFVAGHTYGNTSNEPGFHPPFKDDFDSVRAYPHIEFGVLTGDVVHHGNEESWNIIDSEIAELKMPVYIVPGNHDVYDDYELFKHRYGDPKNNYKTYRYFLYHNDLIILLDGNLDNWNITGDQMAVVKEALDTGKNKVDHVFVFIHQLIWWDDDNEFKNIVINWPPYIPDTTNYWGDLEPMFQNYSAPVYFFAGDLGIFENTTPYMYYKDDNVTYIASGMGSEINDNYIVVTAHSGGKVDFDLIALQGDRHRFGNLEDYVLP